MADNLALSRHVRVVSPQRMAGLRSGAKDDAAFFKTSSDSGIAYLLTGEILIGPKGFTVATRLTDTRAGTDIASNRVESASKADVIGASNQVAAAARRGLRIPLTEQVDTFNADFATQNSDAYEVYVQGLNAVSCLQVRGCGQAVQGGPREGAGLHDGEIPAGQRLCLDGRDRGSDKADQRRAWRGVAPSRSRGPVHPGTRRASSRAGTTMP